MPRSHYRLNRMWGALALFACAAALTACGGSSTETADAPASAESPAAPTSRLEAPASRSTEPAAVEIRDDTALAAVETWIAGVKTGQINAALAVVDPDSKGAAELTKLKAGLARAAESSGATIALAQAALAGEIDALTYDQISDDGQTAVFRFSKPTKPEPWEVHVTHTPDGWRVIPPDTGLPEG